MRKTIAVSAALIAALLLLAGCNFVFSSTVTVAVAGPDSSDTSFDSDVYVFGFTDKAKRDAAFAEIVENGKDASSGDFDDYLYSLYPSGCLDKRVAVYASAGGDSVIPGLGETSGTAATLTIRWNTMSPGFGEDYDSTWVYLIAAVEENGTCYAGRNDWKVNSGSTTNNPLVRMEDVKGIDE